MFGLLVGVLCSMFRGASVFRCIFCDAPFGHNWPFPATQTSSGNRVLCECFGRPTRWLRITERSLGQINRRSPAEVWIMWSPYLELASVIDIGHLVEAKRWDSEGDARWLLGCYTHAVSIGCYPLDAIHWMLSKMISTEFYPMNPGRALSGMRSGQAIGCRAHQFINMYLWEKHIVDRRLPGMILVESAASHCAALSSPYNFMVQRVSCRRRALCTGRQLLASQEDAQAQDHLQHLHRILANQCSHFQTQLLSKCIHKLFS